MSAAAEAYVPPHRRPRPGAAERAVAGPGRLEDLLERWHSNGAEPRGEELWEATRGALRGGAGTTGAEGGLAELLWDAVQVGIQSQKPRERLALPADVAQGILEAIVPQLEAAGASQEPRHTALRLLRHSLPDVEMAKVQPRVRELIGYLAALLTRHSNLRVCTLATGCLARVAEGCPEALQALAEELSRALIAAAQSLSSAVQGATALTASNLRDVAGLLQSLQVLLAEVPTQLEPSALSILACFQPCSIIGADYVRPSRGQAGADAGALAAALSSSETERSEMDAGAAPAPRPGDEAGCTVATLSVQCRAAALRNFAQLFRLFPKSFFGRWALVLDFQSGETSRHGTGLPLLIAICKLDPAQRVRAAALAALCSLLEAPQVRSWPVPLERGSLEGSLQQGGSRASAVPAYTSLAGLVATTLRQSHAVIIGLLKSCHLGDVQSALRACSDLFASTPYPKLRPGLLSEAVQSVLPFLNGLAASGSLEEVPQPAAGAITVLTTALKRDDCSSELARCFYEAPTVPVPVPPLARATGQPVASDTSLRLSTLAARVLSHAPHVAQLARSHRPQQLATPKGGGRRARGSRGSSSNNACAEGDVPLALDYMALVARLAKLRPAEPPEGLWELYQEAVEAVLDHPSEGLRIRARRLLEELLPKGGAGGCDAGWCSTMAHQVFAGLAAEASAQARAASFAALPAVVLAATSGQGAESVAALRPHALAAVRKGVGDSNAAVRTAVAQACGGLVELWFRQDGALKARVDGADLVQLLLPCFTDVSADVRSAGVTAVASVAEWRPPLCGGPGSTGACDGDASGAVRSTEQPEVWARAMSDALQLCSDSSDKARASALRTVGVLAEVLEPDTLDGGALPAGLSTSKVVPPGLSVAPPPGLSPHTGSVEPEPLLVAMAKTLAAGVAKPPPKCQWNACRSIGQVYTSPLFGASPSHAQEAHKLMLEALSRAVVTATNMKVRIQAAQALSQLPAVEALWTPVDADAILAAFCGSLLALYQPGNEQPVDDRQRAQYAAALRVELLGVGERWAGCAPPRPPGEAAEAAVRAASAELLDLLGGRPAPAPAATLCAWEDAGEPGVPLAEAAEGGAAASALRRRLAPLLLPGPGEPAGP